MNTTLKDLIEEGKQIKRKYYYVIECPECHEKIAITGNTGFKVNLFEPHEVEEEYDVLHYTDGTDAGMKGIDIEHKKVKIIRSSDVKKDIVVIEMCPNCGHRNIEMSREDFMNSEQVYWDGKNNISFELDEKETAEARMFMDEHAECCEKHLGKRWFSSTGNQFEYHICPTGMGNCVTIKCLACGDSKDITDSDSW